MLRNEQSTDGRYVVYLKYFKAAKSSSHKIAAHTDRFNLGLKGLTQYGKCQSQDGCIKCSMCKNRPIK